MRRLFWEDPYLKECEATVMGRMGPEVQLDQTILFAFSGGQASDQGKIGGINVQEAVKTDQGITYILERVPEFNEGDKVKVEIDWDYRSKIMRLHSAAHVVFYLFSEKTGITKLIGSNISIDKARLDFAMGTPVSELLPEIEAKANKITEKDIQIKTYGDEQDENRRYWEMDIDGKEVKYPCGGTHVKNAEEIGRIKLKRKNIGAGKERIEITLI